jgi:hypothetical protein
MTTMTKYITNGQKLVTQMTKYITNGQNQLQKWLNKWPFDNADD